jgi:radical SAM-linked protein
MQKIIVRAALPLWYTEGFNPKPKMTFAAPLSVGTESLCELMDLRVTEQLSPLEILSRLNKNSTDEMRFTEAYYPEVPITSIAYLSYTFDIMTLGDITEVQKRCTEALRAPSLKIVKKTKSGEAEVDIAPLVKSTEVKVVDGRLVIDALLSSSPSAFLSPELLVRYLKENAGILSSAKITDEWYTVLRTEAYGEDMQKFR